MDTLTHVNAILSSIGWLVLIGIVWSAARAFGRIDDSITKMATNHLPHLQESLTKLELHQEATTQALRDLHQDMRDLRK